MEKQLIFFMEFNMCIDKSLFLKYSNFIKEIYAEYNIHVVQASRAINSDSSKRGQVDEFLISNYE